MASPASSHTDVKIDATNNQTFPSPLSQLEVPQTSKITVPHSTETEQRSLPTTEATAVPHSASPKGKKKKKSGEKEVVPAPPKFLVADSVAPLTREGGSLNFWSPSTNTFHFPCGMMTPTHFDIAHIARIPSNGEPISWNDHVDIRDSLGIDFSSSSYSNCRDYSSRARLIQPFGPLWVVDLWLKAIFRPCIPRSVAMFPKRAMNGIQLSLLEKPGSPYEFDTFCSFYPWFFDLREDLEGGDYDLFPFVGLPLPAAPCFDSLDFPSDQAYGDEMWAYTLIPQKLRVGAPSEGIREMRYKMNLYSPQFVARQFGFAQALPTPSSFNPKDQLVKYEIDHTDELAQAIEASEE
ncbi:hypothetical protein PIB30_081788 [Stylosanthes scabra]|uniref:Uncharacterized protein n=1 Tax=Stylosanthes scabra TaxID=79078 RepID=A0ABU6YQU4_9FABA|nr:hypothetical protein [Stylosanthes scabra]